MQTYRTILLNTLHNESTDQDLKAVSPRAAADAALTAAKGEGSFSDALVIELHDGVLGAREYWFTVKADGTI